MYVCVSNFDVNLFVQVSSFSYWREYVNERFTVSPTFALSLSALLEVTFWGIDTYLKMCMWALSIGYIYSCFTSNGEKHYLIIIIKIPHITLANYLHKVTTNQMPILNFWRFIGPSNLLCFFINYWCFNDGVRLQLNKVGAMNAKFHLRFIANPWSSNRVQTW